MISLLFNLDKELPFAKFHLYMYLSISIRRMTLRVRLQQIDIKVAHRSENSLYDLLDIPCV